MTDDVSAATNPAPGPASPTSPAASPAFPAASDDSEQTGRSAIGGGLEPAVPPIPPIPAAIAAASRRDRQVADITEALRDVIDPELGINVVDLGLLYGVTIDEAGVAVIDLTLTSAACPLTDLIESQASAAVAGLAEDLRINWVWLPPWGPDRISPDGRAQLRAIGFNV